MTDAPSRGPSGTPGGFWHLFGGYRAFGSSLVLLLPGVGVLFFNGRSILGWLLTLTSTLIIVLGVLTHLNIFFWPTSLVNTLLMLGTLAAGIGLVARSLRAH